MGIFNHHLEGNSLVIDMPKCLDATNAPEADAEIQAICEEYPDRNAVLDCKVLDYISSAGLRVILRLKQMHKSVSSIINVSPTVYEILDCTGFSEMFEVQKAYRTISIEGCELIGTGANGKVYRIDRETIVKTFMNPESLPDILRERELARKAFVKGIPTAISYEVVRIESGGYGAVYELLDSKSLSKLLASGEITVDEAAKMSVDLLKIVHSKTVSPGDFPDIKKKVRSWAEYLRDYLPEMQYRKISRMIEEVPDDSRIVHGDFYIRNIMYQNGECLLIDMDTLSSGNPIFEFGSIYNAYRGFYEIRPAECETFLGISSEMAAELWQKTLACYFEGADEEFLGRIEKSAMLLGHIRLLRRAIKRGGDNSEEQQKMAAHSRERIRELLAELDSFAVVN